MIASSSAPVHSSGGSSLVGAGRIHVERGDQFLQPDARHQLHAQQPLIEVGLDLFGKHLHDVLVLEAGHRAAFAAAIGRDFQRHQPVERQLPGQVHVAERAAAQHADDLEVVDLRAGQKRHRLFERGRTACRPRRRRRQAPGRETWALCRFPIRPARRRKRRAGARGVTIVSISSAGPARFSVGSCCEGLLWRHINSATEITESAEAID